MYKSILFLLLFAVSAQAKIVVKKCSPTCVILNGQTLPRGMYTASYTYADGDSTITISRTLDTSYKYVLSKHSSWFLDGDNSNVKFTYMADLKIWMDAYFELAGTPSSTTYLRGDGSWSTPDGGGDPADPSTSIQFNDDGEFAGDADFFWDGTAVNLRTNGIATTLTPGSVYSNTTAATSGVPYQYPPLIRLNGTTWNNSASVVSGWQIDCQSTRQTTNVRPTMSLDVTRDNWVTTTPVLTLAPYAATPVNTFNVGGVTVTSGSLSMTAGNVNINTGYQLNMNGTSLIQLSQTIVGDLPAAAGSFGKMTTVTDATAPTVGATVVGGGAATALVWSNGTNWTVIGQ